MNISTARRSKYIALALGLTWLLGCGLEVREPDFDPDVLAQAAQAGVGLTGDEMFSRVRAALAEAYPDAIAPSRNLTWVLNNDQGMPGQVAVLYASRSRYLVFVGSPVPVQWTLGPSTVGEKADCRLAGGFEVTDFVLEGQLLTYGEGQFEAQTNGAGARVELSECAALSYRIDNSAWMLEYGRGRLPSTIYEDAFGATSTVASIFAALPSAIAAEYITSYVYRAFGMSPSLFGSF